MTRGRNVHAEIDMPQTVEIPAKGKKKVEVQARITLHNSGTESFVAHAQNADDRHFWHVFDEDLREVHRERGKGKGGAVGVKVKQGVHSYQTRTIAAGLGVHGQRKLVLDASKLEEGHTYTVRAEIYGHPAEATFIAVKGAPPKPAKPAAKARQGAKKKAGSKKVVSIRRAAARKKSVKKSAKKASATKKPAARKAAKKTARGRKK